MANEYFYELKPAYSLLRDGDYLEWSVNDMAIEFGIFDNDIAGCDFVYSEYNQGSYEGDAFVVFIRDGKLFEVNASHCSCYGLDGTWEPEETTLSALLARPNVPPEAKENLKKMVVEKFIQ